MIEMQSRNIGCFDCRLGDIKMEAPTCTRSRRWQSGAMTPALREYSLILITLSQIRGKFLRRSVQHIESSTSCGTPAGIYASIHGGEKWSPLSVTSIIVGYISNMVAGGFRNDLIALGDCIEHDDRYDRIVEYVSIMKSLFDEPGADLYGRLLYCQKSRGKPRNSARAGSGGICLRNRSGGIAAARKIGATSISYPGTPRGEKKSSIGVPAGVRIGIIAREESREAWRIAHERYPTDRKGKLTHAMARRVSDSAWYEQLSELGDRPAESGSPTGLYHLITIRPSAHIWSVVTTRCAARSQNISRKAFRRLFLMCHRAGKNCTIQPWFLIAPTRSSGLGC